MRNCSTFCCQTCLSAGTYCDVISGDVVDGACSGIEVTVGDDGTAYIEILTTANDGVIAIHAEVSERCCVDTLCRFMALYIYALTSIEE